MAGHWTGDCRRGWHHRGGHQNHENMAVALSELIAPLCATQVPGKLFSAFLIGQMRLLLERGSILQ
jgi:hypothetical protein